MVVRVKRENETGGSSTELRRRSRRLAVDDSSNQQQQQEVGEEVHRDDDEDEDDDNDVEEDELSLRRALRSRYLTIKNLLYGEGEGSPEVDCDRFKTMIDEVETLHQKVQKPREQVADAEALLDITSSFVKSVKAQKNDGVTPSDFVSCLLRDFGRSDRASSSADSARDSILWRDIGLAVSNIFKKGAGCGTMLGPMTVEPKKRKSSVRKKHTKPTETARPEELNNNAEEKTDTDKNMSTMFGILRKHRKVQLEHLVLNRSSYAQTVENLFALSFLVKDGRAEISANESGHFVCPRNAPAAEAVTSGKVSYGHFVFRFDFKDWKLMLETVEHGEELMPHRVPADLHNTTSSEPPENSAPVEHDTATTTTPIRKLSRNRGLVIQEQTVVEDSPEGNDIGSRAAYIRKGKRKLV